MKESSTKYSWNIILEAEKWWIRDDKQMSEVPFQMKIKRPTIYHRELCSMLCASLDGRGAWGRMETCICMAEFLHCSPETITLLIGYTQIQDKKFKIKMGN